VLNFNRTRALPTAPQWKQLADAVRWNVQPFIDGRYRSSDSTDRFDNLNPATEAVLCSVPVGSASDVSSAVELAGRRFADGCWSERPAVRRAETLCRWAELIVERKAELALLDALEMGKPIRIALQEVGVLAPTLLRSWAGLADKLLGSAAPLHHGTLCLNAYEPRGVIAAITPWNSPTLNAVFKIGPALAAGNTMVLKPSELSPSSALRLAELAVEAGVPAGVLNVVPGRGSTVGVALVESPGVDLISFTGSTATGRRVMELSGRSHGRPLLLECGGKSPQVVWPDVDDLDVVADAVVRGVIYNQGQVCSAHTRVIVHEEIREALLARMVSRAGQCHAGDPLDESTTFGPLASPEQRDRVQSYIELGEKEGAVPVLRGTRQESPACAITPTIFDRVASEMTIVREEIFGPVLCVQTFRNEEEATTLANATDFGLAATIWTRDSGQGRRLARAIRAGHITVRTGGREAADSGCILGCEPQKASGFGAELGLQGLQSYSSLKSVNFRGA
jgi:acyl-CoA reductase-like NAD-dependent aldehyde dehydrogenase